MPDLGDWTCLLCQTTRPSSVGEWYRVIDRGHIAAPFCSQVCRQAFARLRRERRYELVFGSWERGTYLMREHPGARPAQSMEPDPLDGGEVYIVQWRRHAPAVPCQHSDRSRTWDDGKYICCDCATQSLTLLPAPYTP